MSTIVTQEVQVTRTVIGNNGPVIPMEQLKSRILFSYVTKLTYHNLFQNTTGYMVGTEYEQRG